MPGKIWAARALDYWAAGNAILVAAIAIAHTVFTGDPPWVMAVYLVYPAVVGIAWTIRWLTRRFG